MFLVLTTIFFLVLITIAIMEYNKFVMLNNKLKQSKSAIEIYLNQRFDLIPNLVECVKGYIAHEQETLTKVAELRSQFAKDKDLGQGAKLNSEFIKLVAIGENNPTLQASEQFLNLQKNLTKMESQLQAARRVYNGDVTIYNTTITTFPNNMFALIYGFSEEALFEIEEYKKENINISMR